MLETIYIIYYNCNQQKITLVSHPEMRIGHDGHVIDRQGTFRQSPDLFQSLRFNVVRVQVNGNAGAVVGLLEDEGQGIVRVRVVVRILMFCGRSNILLIVAKDLCGKRASRAIALSTSERSGRR